MAYALLADVGRKNNGTTAAIDTTGAGLLIAAVSYGTGTSGTLSDSKGNSWTALTARTDGSQGIRLFYSPAPAVGAGHTFSLSGGGFPAFHVLAFSGAHAAPFDAEGGAGSGGSVSSLAPGSLTPSEANCLVVTGLGYGWSGASSGGVSGVTGGFSFYDQSYVSGSTLGCGIAYLIQTSAAAANPTWSWAAGAASNAAAAIASFKAAAGTPIPVFAHHYRQTRGG